MVATRRCCLLARDAFKTSKIASPTSLRALEICLSPEPLEARRIYAFPTDTISKNTGGFKTIDV